MKKILAMVLASVMMLAMLTVGVSADENKTVKIGVLVSDVSGEEALGFASYYQNYILE